MVVLAVVWCRLSGPPLRGPQRVNLLIGIGVQSVGSDNKPKEKVEQWLYSDGICCRGRIHELLKLQIMLSEIYDILCLDAVTPPCSDKHAAD